MTRKSEFLILSSRLNSILTSFSLLTGARCQVLLPAADRGLRAAAAGVGGSLAQPLRPGPRLRPPLALGRRRRQRTPRRSPGALLRQGGYSVML